MKEVRCLLGLKCASSHFTAFSFAIGEATRGSGLSGCAP